MRFAHVEKTIPICGLFAMRKAVAGLDLPIIVVLDNASGSGRRQKPDFAPSNVKMGTLRKRVRGR